MPSLDTYRKQAKQLVRWHRGGNYSVGEKVRLLERHRHLTDPEVLKMAMPLTLAQEIVAVEAGYRDWAALKAAAPDAAKLPAIEACPPALGVAVPILFVRDVGAASAFYEQTLGFEVEFLHGNPPFYGSVSRDDARLHLRFVHQTNFSELAAREGELILALIEVGDVKALFQEYESRQVNFAQRLVRQPWGGLEFHVKDPDGNVISFVQFRRPAAEEHG
jgi:catechol 2,3-dioxygenase-like lactoylglutathione lyase family enzyme